MLESFERGAFWKLTEINCPLCNSKNVALILWGYPEETQALEQELERKAIVLGGCLITDHDPKWECNECHHKWGDAEHNEESDKTDSFDYDQGFNLDEVYDQ